MLHLYRRESVAGLSLGSQMLCHSIKRLSSKWHCTFKGKIMYSKANKWVCEFGSLPPSLLAWVLSLGLVVDGENWLPKVVLLPSCSPSILVETYMHTHTHTYTEYKIYLKIFVLQKLFLSALCFWLSFICVFNQSVLVAPVKGIAAAFKLITDLVTTGALGSRFSSHVRPHPFPSCFHFCKGGACRQKEGKRRLNTKAHFLNFLMVIIKWSAVRSHWARIGS